MRLFLKKTSLSVSEASPFFMPSEMRFGRKFDLNIDWLEPGRFGNVVISRNRLSSSNFDGDRHLDMSLFLSTANLGISKQLKMFERLPSECIGLAVKLRDAFNDSFDLTGVSRAEDVVRGGRNNSSFLRRKSKKPPFFSSEESDESTNGLHLAFRFLCFAFLPSGEQILEL